MREFLALVLFALVGCSSDPVSYSTPVGISLKAKSGDVAGSVISDDKQITTESGNPYGAFISDAHTKLGKDPTRIEIDKLTLVLGAQSTNVTTLEEVYTGDVDVTFLTNDTNNTYDVGHVMNPMGVGPVDLSVVFQSDAVAAADFTKILGGGFRVVIRGAAAAGFSGKGAEATLQTTFTFAAFE
jgi:hypothetical protein